MPTTPCTHTVGQELWPIRDRFLAAHIGRSSPHPILLGSGNPIKSCTITAALRYVSTTPVPYNAAPCPLRLPEGALELWRFTATSHSREIVLPDGCRDLIVSMTAHAEPACFVTSLADHVETPEFIAGQQLVGVRLHAGAQFDERALLDGLAEHDRFDGDDLLSAIGAAVRVDPLIHEALAWLAGAPQLDTARASLGLSARSLERLLTSKTGRTPVCWRNLARARRCARALFGAEPLIAIAADFGYADQAHMTRDMQRWFGTSPTRLRLDAERFKALNQSGFG
jgi:AraC-like DNA-binding protein